MHLLCLSGSLRNGSSNTALLRATTLVAALRSEPTTCRVFDGISDLPAFSPDLEGVATPTPILNFAKAVDEADGLIISCPEYVRALPGTFKNALD